MSEDNGTVSDLLDEIYFLRHILVSEARILEAHLDYKTFPKSRRGYAESQVKRMRAAATGGAHELFRTTDTYKNSKREMDAIGASQTLTVWEWEKEREAQRD